MTHEMIFAEARRRANKFRIEINFWGVLICIVLR